MNSEKNLDIKLDPLSHSVIEITKGEMHLKQTAIGYEKSIQNNNNNSDNNDSNQNEDSKSNAGGCAKYIGLTLTLVHVLAFTLCAVIIKSLPYHPFCIGIWRFQGILVPSAIVLLVTYLKQPKRVAKTDNASCQIGSSTEKDAKINSDSAEEESFFATIWPISKNWTTILFLMLRGFLGTTAMLLFFYSIKFIGIADSLVINATSPVFVTIIAYFWLKEPCGVFPIILALLSVLGIFIVVRPPILTGAKEFDSNTVIGCSLATGGLFFSVTSFVIIRSLKNVPVPIITFCFGLWGFSQSLILGLSINVLSLPATIEHSLLAIALAILTFTAQVSLTTALKYDLAGPTSMIRSTANVIFSFIWPFVFFGDIPDTYSLIGASIVMICILGTIFRKWLTELEKDHVLRKYLCFILK